MRITVFFTSKFELESADRLKTKLVQYCTKKCGYWRSRSGAIRIVLFVQTTSLNHLSSISSASGNVPLARITAMHCCWRSLIVCRWRLRTSFVHSSFSSSFCKVFCFVIVRICSRNFKFSILQLQNAVCKFHCFYT